MNNFSIFFRLPKCIQCVGCRWIWLHVSVQCSSVESEASNLIRIQDDRNRNGTKMNIFIRIFFSAFAVPLAFVRHIMRQNILFIFLRRSLLLCACVHCAQSIACGYECARCEENTNEKATKKNWKWCAIDSVGACARVFSLQATDHWRRCSGSPEENIFLRDKTVDLIQSKIFW